MPFYNIITSPIYFYYAYSRGYGFFELKTWLGFGFVLIFSYLFTFVIKQAFETASHFYMKKSNVEPFGLLLWGIFVSTCLSIILGEYAVEVLVKLNLF